MAPSSWACRSGCSARSRSAAAWPRASRSRAQRVQALWGEGVGRVEEAFEEAGRLLGAGAGGLGAVALARRLALLEAEGDHRARQQQHERRRRGHAQPVATDELPS